MKINIDGKIVEVLPEDKNLVDVADRARVGLPAPCYRSKGNKGCCNACVVEINGKQELACATKPEEGMVVVVSRDDLNKLRTQRIIEYIKSSNTGSDGCCCGCDCSEGSRGCC